MGGVGDLEGDDGRDPASPDGDVGGDAVDGRAVDPRLGAALVKHRSAYWPV